MRSKLGRRELRTVGQHDDQPTRGVWLHIPLRCAISRVAAAASAATGADAMLQDVQLRLVLRCPSWGRMRHEHPIAGPTARDRPRTRCLWRLLFLCARDAVVGLRG